MLENENEEPDTDTNELQDTLNAIGHVVEIHATSLPKINEVKGVNWRAKLILAELQDWMKDKSKEDAAAEFCQMLEKLKTRTQSNEENEIR